MLYGPRIRENHTLLRNEGIGDIANNRYDVMVLRFGKLHWIFVALSQEITDFVRNGKTLQRVGYNCDMTTKIEIQHDQT